MLTLSVGGINSRVRITGAAAACGMRDSWTRGVTRTQGLAANAAVPAGYGPKAFALARSPGGIAAALVASASGVAGIVATGTAAGTSAGSVTSSASARMLYRIAGTTAGLATVTAAVRGAGTISASLRIGANPSADEVADTLLDTKTVLPGVTVRQALKRAMLGGENAFAVSA
jgi:hypothetical protein